MLIITYILQHIVNKINIDKYIIMSLSPFKKMKKKVEYICIITAYIR